MKKYVIATVILILMLVFIGCTQGVSVQNADYLRIHIRANSNSFEDQELKLAVRDALIECLTPIFKDAKTASDAERAVIKNKDAIEDVINEFLSLCDCPYKGKVRVDTEYFEKNTYGELTLESGFYRAVIVELGKAEGKNWWCVAYPPLCFAGADDYNTIKYESYFYQLFKKRSIRQ